MVEGGWGDFSFHNADAWVAANVGTEKVTAEHIAEKHHREKSVQNPIVHFIYILRS